MPVNAKYPPPVGLAALVPPARKLVWALPLWALLLGLSTLTHQPSYDTDFAGYADYVTTDQFLASHLVASILGAGLGIVGAFALVVLLAETRGARVAFWGLAALTIAQVLNTAVFGVAAFFQPAVGETYFGGDRAVAEAINENVYGADLFALVGVGLLLWIVGLTQLARAMRAADGIPTWARRAFAIAGPTFAISGFAFDLLQPVAGFVLAAAAAVAASRLASPRVDTAQARGEGRGTRLARVQREGGRPAAQAAP